MLTATKSTKIKLNSENITKEFANTLSSKIKVGDIIFLYGEIGVGKTTFVKYLINIIQKKNKLEPSEVTSPTFNILNEYQIKQIKINHYDLFRLKSVNEVKNLGLFDDSSKSITLIEWPQLIQEKPKNLIELTFTYENDYQIVLLFFTQQPTKILFSVFIVLSFFFSALTISEIFEDYIKDQKIKNVANKVLNIFAIIMPLITITGIYNLS